MWIKINKNFNIINQRDLSNSHMNNEAKSYDFYWNYITRGFDDFAKYYKTKQINYYSQGKIRDKLLND